MSMWMIQMFLHLSVNSYGTAGPTTNNKQPVRKNSMIRKNDNYFMNTNTYGTDVPGSYRLENLNACLLQV